MSFPDVSLRLPDAIDESHCRLLWLTLQARIRRFRSIDNELLGDKIGHYCFIALFNLFIVFYGVRLVEDVHESRAPANHAVQVLASFLLHGHVVEQVLA